MNEDFLHYLWKFQFFDKKNLYTLCGRKLAVFDPGKHNHDAGPDFLKARISLDGQECFGDVELHVRSAEWEQHKHHLDSAYNRVVLHVSWEHSRDIIRKDGRTIPALTLSGRAEKRLLLSYQRFIYDKSFIPCASQASEVFESEKKEAIQTALKERLLQKSNLVLENYQAAGNNWEEAAYRILAKAFGLHKNQEPFVLLAQRLPYKIIRKHSDSLLRIEALLFGMAGFLNSTKIEETEDAYFQELKKEFDFLAHKYELKDKILPQGSWKFARLRPPAFPTRRLAFFAALLYRREFFYKKLTGISSLREMLDFMGFESSAYWQTHYKFGKESKTKTEKPGRFFIELVSVNAVVPLLYATARQKQDKKMAKSAFELLMSLPAEKNSIVSGFKKLKFPAQSAADTQGLLQLHKYGCTEKKCLKCPVGLRILERKTEE